MIKNHRGELLNSKAEFHQPSLMKIRSEITNIIEDWGVTTINFLQFVQVTFFIKPFAQVEQE